MQHARLTLAERAHVLDQLTFGPDYPELNATWTQLKAKLPRLISHIARVEVSGDRSALADVAILDEDDSARASGAPVFPLFLTELRSLEAKLGSEATATKGCYVCLRVHPDVGNLPSYYRTMVLTHELLHLADILRFGPHGHYTYQLAYARETARAGYRANRFERRARFIGSKRGLQEMVGIHPRLAAKLAAEWCDRAPFLPDYNELAAAIRKHTRKRSRARC